MTCELSHRESSESYCRVIARAQRFRVIICKDTIQWIIQYRIGDAERGAGSRWRALSYHRSRSALIRLWHVKTKQPVPGEISNLPENIPPPQTSKNSALRSADEGW
ncbi:MULTISPECIES: hypothetical protein [unclassified Leisingera]|uniref:hypothetical protein n=1 Tax=unclassified Leisingera TaxID=2614906 RepID=UPI00036B8834|nr:MULTISPECIES: hypothetical protein [unclassified Leisingera]KIC55086.1 hypothetical protein RA22_03245 [Leisingera sp. ANG-S]